jgi:hypothetical protein
MHSLFKVTTTAATTRTRISSFATPFRAPQCNSGATTIAAYRTLGSYFFSSIFFLSRNETALLVLEISAC